ncbi:steroid 17-alpha-hydroxylase/17,20 lyase-like [Saccoglossus kowalevskii]
MLLEAISCGSAMCNMLIGGLVLLVIILIWSIRRPPGMPPGPRGLPIIGSLLSITQNMHLDFLNMAKKYGDVFTIKLGSHQVVVLNNYELILEALVKKQFDFAGRPHTFTGDMFSEGGQDIALSDFGTTWKLHRKIAHQAIRDYVSGRKLERLIREDAFPLLQEILEENDGKSIHPRPLVLLLVNNIMAQFCFGQKYTLDDPEFKSIMKLVDDFVEIGGNGLVADIIPWLAYIPTKGVREIRKMTDVFLRMMYDKFYEHKKKFDKDKLHDLIDYLLNVQRQAQEDKTENIDSLNDTRLVQTVSDLFGAGIDTTTHTLDWAIMFLVHHPDVQAKVAREIDDVIGGEQFPLISDRPRMPYCDAVIHEVMRVRTVAPMSVPHKAMVDSTIGGYNIPKDTWVMINLWAVQMDKKHWDNPEEFKPERFLEKDGTLKPKQDNFMPFSAGRRVCLGESLAKPEIFLLFTSLFQRFQFSHVPGKALPQLDGTASALILRAPDYEVIVRKRL